MREIDLGLKVEVETEKTLWDDRSLLFSVDDSIKSGTDEVCPHTY